MDNIEDDIKKEAAHALETMEESNHSLDRVYIPVISFQIVNNNIANEYANDYLRDMKVLE